MKSFILSFGGILCVVGSAYAEYVPEPRLGETSAYDVIAISEDEYNANVSGNVYKAYDISEDGSLVPQYYQYNVDENKEYADTVTRSGYGSGDGENPEVDAGAALNNSGDIKWTTTVYIKDTGEIWMYGKLYGGYFSNVTDNHVTLSIGGETYELALGEHT